MSKSKNSKPHKHQNRYDKTLTLMNRFVPDKEKRILDLGVENAFSFQLKDENYLVENTPAGLDLDENIAWFNQKKYDVVTAFEIFEHLLNPYEILKAIQADKIIISVPLKLWFAKAYRNKDDVWDQHYHEFEDWQFDMLLKKTGWKIIYRDKWKIYDNKIGFRPLLRRLYPRIYVVVAERIR
jgi:hypothetical protein